MNLEVVLVQPSHPERHRFSELKAKVCANLKRDVVFFLLGALTSLIVSHCYYSKSQHWAERQAYISGQFKLPEAMRLGELQIGGLLISMGSSVVSFNTSDLKYGCDQGIKLWGIIRDQDRRSLLNLDGDLFTVTPSYDCDVNRDSEAIEVVNSEFRPILQLWKSKSNTWMLFFVSYTNDTVATVVSDGFAGTMHPDEATRIQMMRRRMFQYPGVKNPSIRSGESIDYDFDFKRYYGIE